MPDPHSTRRDSSDTQNLLIRLEDGDPRALDLLLESYRNYLKKLIDLRMDNELRVRVDPSDVVQEAQLVASQRIDDFLRRRPGSFRVWLRSTALERMVDLHRRHLAEKRSVRREVPRAGASSLATAQHPRAERPSQIAHRRELATEVRQVITGLGRKDQEILMLRHVEELTNAEAAEVLAIAPATARKRLGRALLRLAKLLDEQGIQLDS